MPENVGPVSLPNDWWTSENVASYLGIQPSTVSAYVTRDQMPKPDRYMGRVRLWKPDTIKNWHQARPRINPTAIEGIELAKVITGASHAPVVYFLRVSDKVKIGTSTRLLVRMRSLAASLADVALVVPGGEDVERQYHERFAAQRIQQSEWFNVAGELLSFLTSKSGPDA